MVLNNHPSDCFHCLVTADVLLVAKSTFSMVAAMLSGPLQVRIYPAKPGDLWEHNAAGENWIVSSVAGRMDEAEFERQTQAMLAARALDDQVRAYKA
jgi:hypothetical protein